MDLQLTDRVALVTGASSNGLGRAIARGLAEEGAQLIVTSRREKLLNEFADEVADKGLKRPIVIASDIMEPGAPKKLAEAALAEAGKIDILINAAGGSRIIPFHSEHDVWEEAMTLNSIRPRELAEAVIPSMIDNGFGRIVNITGKSEPERPLAGKINAAMAAKSMLHMWSKDAAREVGPHGITINSIGPGKIMSEQIRKKYTEEDRKAVAADIPAGYFGEPEDLSCVAVFLASPIARYVTGTILAVDGGYRRYAY